MPFIGIVSVFKTKSYRAKAENDAYCIFFFHYKLPFSSFDSRLKIFLLYLFITSEAYARYNSLIDF